jgi:hypothetical protein
MNWVKQPEYGFFCFTPARTVPILRREKRSGENKGAPPW